MMQNYSDALFLYVLSDKNEKTKKLSDELKVGIKTFRTGSKGVLIPIIRNLVISTSCPKQMTLID